MIGMFSLGRVLSSVYKASPVANRTLASLAGKNLMCISELSHDELEGLINHSIDIKKAWKLNAELARAQIPLKGQSMSMIFQKRSTRTRVSTETGIFMLGGHALMLGPQDIQLGVNETLRDTASVLCRFNDIILARVFAHADVVELAKYSSVPVINALSDKYHPLQTLADLMTLKEHFHGNLKGKTLSWIGDGNNVMNDLVIGALKQGMSVKIATPQGYTPDEDIIATANGIAKEFGSKLLLTHDPKIASEDSNVIVTDTWISMGQESDAAKRKKDFTGYQVNSQLLSLAAEDVVFLHCLPRKLEEVSDEVFYSSKSLVFPEAENRMWTLMAVTLELLGKRWGNINSIAC